MRHHDTPSRTISCDHCAMRCTSHCDDCVVSFVVESEATGAPVVQLDPLEEHAVALLGRAGLVPRLRFREAS